MSKASKERRVRSWLVYSLGFGYSVWCMACEMWPSKGTVRDQETKERSCGDVTTLKRETVQAETCMRLGNYEQEK